MSLSALSSPLEQEPNNHAFFMGCMAKEEEINNAQIGGSFYFYTTIIRYSSFKFR